MKDKSKLKFIISHYGEKSQALQAVEEMSELTKAIIKRVNRNVTNLFDVMDEIADVSIMLDQLIIIFNINETALNKHIESKTNRTIERIQNETRKA